jgi:hypothetical protein
MAKGQGRKRAADPKRAMLRHTVATVAYRGGKALRGVPPGFPGFRAGDTSRTAGELLAHVGDLFDWALSIAKGREAWHDSKPLPWDREVERFFAALAAFDACLASEEPLHGEVERLFQGPVADALTHVGQIAMLRRLAGAPVRGENFFGAEIAYGGVGPEQSYPKREFD